MTRSRGRPSVCGPGRERGVHSSRRCSERTGLHPDPRAHPWRDEVLNRDGIYPRRRRDIQPVERPGQLALGDLRLQSRLSHGLGASLGTRTLAVEPEREPAARLAVRHDERVLDAVAFERDERTIGICLRRKARDINPVAARHRTRLGARPWVESPGLEQRCGAVAAGEIPEGADGQAHSGGTERSLLARARRRPLRRWRLVRHLQPRQVRDRLVHGRGAWRVNPVRPREVREVCEQERKESKAHGRILAAVAKKSRVLLIGRCVIRLGRGPRALAGPGPARRRRSSAGAAAPPPLRRR